MELYSAEVAKAKSLIVDWWAHPETELEATFGLRGQVDIQTFLAVAERLRGRGLEEVTQQDKLNICLPDHVRFTLVGFGVIQQYCKDDILAGKPFDAMIKNRSSVADSNLDIQDYNLRIKSRKETPMANNDARVNDILGTWPSQKKAFRLIKRWTFRGKGVRYDLSMVRSTPRDLKNDFKWVRKFKDNALLNSLPLYEIEVELERSEFNNPEDAYKGFMRGIGEVMRGIQRNSLLIRKSKIQSVLDEYAAVVGTPIFRGVSPKTLEFKNMTSSIEDKVPNIRQGYNVTDKADGLRVHAFCGGDGELYLIDMSMTVYKTGLSNSSCANSLLDGEWVTRDNDNKQIHLLLLFDVYIAVGEDVSKLPFQGGRHTKMTEWAETFNGSNLKKAAGSQILVSYKTFLFGKDGDKSIFLNAGRIRDTARIYPTDGLIFSSNTAPIPSKPSATFDYQFKWKPSEDNTIDFLVTIEKDPDLQSQDRLVNGIHPVSGELKPYKILRLYVGSSTDPAYDDPRATILYNQPLPSGIQEFGKGKDSYKPILFNPKDYPDTMANVCYREVLENKDTGDFYSVTERTIEPIRDRAIIECRYDSSQPPGWRWIPIRVRNDKTERLLKAMATKKIKKGDSVYARTLNSEKVAESVWNSIHEPITESMIRTGSEQPTDLEASDLITDKTAVSRKYYDRKAPKEDLMKVRGMIDFHNKYIKDRVLYQKVFMNGPGLSVIDVAVGKAGDLHRWVRGKASFVLGIDAAGENIRDSKNGAYSRYMSLLVDPAGGRDNVPTCVFVIGESQGNYHNGEAGATPEERDMLRSVFGKVRPEGAVPPYIGQYAAGRLANGADIITCQFAVHYFFKDEQMFNGLLTNIKENLKIGGYFIGTTFDGEKVFQMLRGLPEGGHKSGTDNTSVLWTITKRYALDEIPNGSGGFGIPIDVDFISIGTSQTEYLVPFSLLVDKLKSIGLELLDTEELNKLGLSTSTALFDTTYEIAKKNGSKYEMNDGIKQFSFLNRWFIFKRISDGLLVEEAKEPLEKTAINEVVTIVKEDTAIEVPTEGSAIIEADREVPVDITSVPSMLTKTYSSNEIFQFYMDSALQDKLKIGDKGAGKWLSPGAPFPIPDTDTADIYPSVEHYIAAMRLKIASNKPELGSAIYSSQGDIHQKYIRERLELTQGGTKALSEDKDSELLKKEITEVRDSQRPAALKKYGAVVDEAKFAASKNKVIRDALRIRLEKDARFRRIVEAVRDQGKVLLYYTGTSPSSELGGYRGADEKIHGENKIGRFIMELAGGFR